MSRSLLLLLLLAVTWAVVALLTALGLVGASVTEALWWTAGVALVASMANVARYRAPRCPACGTCGDHAFEEGNAILWSCIE